MKPYRDLRVTTQTYIISTNITVDCKELFEQVECVPLLHPLCKNVMQVNPEEKVPDGSIVYAEYKTRFKGTIFKKNRKKTMLNCITLIIKYDKFYNTKVSSKGNLQVTGCVDDNIPNFILDTFWKLLQHIPSIWELITPPARAFMYPVMVNVSFSIGFEIDRERLSRVINTKTEHKSILEESDGYVGVNIKIFCQEEALPDIPIRMLALEETKWTEETTRFENYLTCLSHKEQEKKLNKPSSTTFLVFYSGKTIMSGSISRKNREKAYNIFMDIVTHYRNEIEIIREIEEPIQEAQPRSFCCAHSEPKTCVLLEHDKLILCHPCWTLIFNDCFEEGIEPKFDWNKIKNIPVAETQPALENTGKNNIKPCPDCKNSEVSRFKITLKNHKRIFRCFQCFKTKMLCKFLDIEEAQYIKI